MKFPYKIYEPFQDPNSLLWIGEYSKIYNFCWIDEHYFHIWLFLGCLFTVGCFNTAGSRRRRGHSVFWTSSVCIIWAANLFGMYGQSWLHGTYHGHGTLSRFDRMVAYYRADLYFGLSGLNVTVSITKPKNLSNVMFHEFVPWQTGYSGRAEINRRALERGAVNPMLTVLDYYNAPGELGMGSALRRATQFASDMLWVSVACTAYLMVQLAFLPQYVSYALIANALVLKIAYVSFLMRDPRKAAAMFMDGRRIELSYGWTFQLVVVTSSLTLVFGIGLWVHRYFVRKISVHSPWEADYGTPYYWKGDRGPQIPPLASEGKTRMRSYSESSPVKKPPRAPTNTPSGLLDDPNGPGTASKPGYGTDWAWSGKAGELQPVPYYKDEDNDSDEQVVKKTPFSAPTSPPPIPAPRSNRRRIPVDPALLARRLSSLRIEPRRHVTPPGFVDRFNAIDFDSPDPQESAELKIEPTPPVVHKRAVHQQEKKSPESPFEVLTK